MSASFDKRVGRQASSRAAIIALVAAVLWLLPLAVAAADTSGTRIGYVDMKRLFDTMPQLIAARDELDDQFRPRNEALVSDEERLETMQRELAEASGLSEQERIEREREISNMRRSIERRREDLADEIRYRTNMKTESLRETIEVAVRQVAREAEYDLVLNSPVAYASEAIDITDRVLEWLEEDFSRSDPTATR